MKDKHIEDSAAPLIEHLAELRKRLMWAIGFLVVAILCLFPFAEHIFFFLGEPACDAFKERDRPCDFKALGVEEIFFTYISVSVFAGFCVAFPMIAMQLWRFVAPGLYTQEQNAVLPFLIATPAMFALGAGFAYYMAMPLAMDFFLSFEAPQAEGREMTLTVEQTADKYLRLTMKFILAFGICFQLPVALTLMGKAGLCSSAGLARNRKYAVVGILVVAAVATPPDVFSQILLFAVVYGLYEISVQLVRMVEEKRRERMREEGYTDEELDDWDADDDVDEALDEDDGRERQR